MKLSHEFDNDEDTSLLSDCVLKMESGDKVKVKFALEQAMKAKRRSTLPLTSVLFGVGGQLHAPAVLPPEKTRYPL